MALLRLLSLPPALSFLSMHAQQPPLTAAEIMSRVAANQDRSEAERAHYVYVQDARVLSRKGKNIRCEEITDTRVTSSNRSPEPPPAPHAENPCAMAGAPSNQIVVARLTRNLHSAPERNMVPD
jgi:hypothetical protein